MTKKGFFLFLLIFSIGFFSFWYHRSEKDKNLYKIAIIKTASHPALNAVVENFTKEFQEKSDQKIIFIEKNAEGSVTNADTIAQQLFYDSTIDLFLTVGTIASQAILSKEFTRPIFFTAVSYPHKLGIAEGQSNVCGIADGISLDFLFQSINSLFPQKKIGSLFTAGELNSISMIEEMQKKAFQLNLFLTSLPINNETDIPLALQALCKKVDIIVLPIDNTIATSITLIAKITENYSIPLFLSDISLLKYGGIAATGTNYSKIGNKAAKLVYLIFQKKRTPSEIGFTQFEDKTLYINKSLFEKYLSSHSLQGIAYKYL